MIPKVVEARYEHDFTVHVRFSDGTEGDVDLIMNSTARSLSPSKILLCFKHSPSIQNSTRCVGPMEPTSLPSSCTSKYSSQHNNRIERDFWLAAPLRSAANRKRFIRNVGITGENER